MPDLLVSIIFEIGKLYSLLVLNSNMSQVSLRRLFVCYGSVPSVQPIMLLYCLFQQGGPGLEVLGP